MTNQQVEVNVNMNSGVSGNRKKNSGSTSIAVSYETRKRLNIMKTILEHNSMDNLINELLNMKFHGLNEEERIAYDVMMKYTK